MAASSINIQWTFRDDGTDGSGSDALYLAVYNEAMKEWFAVSNAENREEESTQFDLPESWGLPDVVHVYCSFLSEDQLVCSNTQYLRIAQ